MVGGTLVWITSLFCAARRRADDSGKEPSPGVYVELAPSGFAKGCTAAVESKVARQELERDGLALDVKAVRRIAVQGGAGMLRDRWRNLMAFRSGTLLAGTELQEIPSSPQDKARPAGESPGRSR